MRLLLALILALAGAGAATAQKFPLTTGPSDPLILGSDEAPYFGAPNPARGPAVMAPSRSVVIVQGRDMFGTAFVRESDDTLPTMFDVMRWRGTRQNPQPMPPNAFIGQLRFGYAIPPYDDQPIGLVYGATVDVFAGYGPAGRYGYGGYMRLRTTAAGSNVPLNVLVLQQSAPDATNYLQMWNAPAGGDVVVESVAAGTPATAGVNIITAGAAPLKHNGVPLVDQDAMNALIARVAELEARLAAAGMR